jgi:hypothetical protein
MTIRRKIKLRVLRVFVVNLVSFVRSQSSTLAGNHKPHRIQPQLRSLDVFMRQQGHIL